MQVLRSLLSRGHSAARETVAQQDCYSYFESKEVGFPSPFFVAYDDILVRIGVVHAGYTMVPSVYRQAIDQIKSIPQDLQWHLLAFVRVLTGITFQDESSQKLAVKGTYRNGNVELAEAVEQRDGQAVIVTFLDRVPEASEPEVDVWVELDDILNDCQVSTGIHDLAAQHDHYIHGTSKHTD